MKIKHVLIAAACLVPVVATVDSTPASAYLTTCTPSGNGTENAHSFCSNHVNNGGLNQQRVKTWCVAVNTGFPRPDWGWRWGPWVNEDQTSSFHCGTTSDPQQASATTYELR